MLRPQPQSRKRPAEDATEDKFAKMLATLGDDSSSSPVGAAPPSSAPLDEDVSEFSIGYVKEMFPDKGYSHLTLDPSDESSVIIIDKSVASPESLEKCHAIAFKSATNENGETIAGSPAWLLVGKVEPGQEVCWGAHVGTIDKVNPSSGDAWINAPTALSQYGDKPYIFRKVMALCELQMGDDVRFDVHVSPAGKPQVQAPLWRKASSKPHRGNFSSPQSKGKSASKGSNTDFSNLSTESLEKLIEKELGGQGGAEGGADAQGEMMIGILKESCPEKGHSFLTVDPDDPSSRVYVHGSVASPALLEKTGAVAFKPHFNAKGDLQASAPVWLLMGRIDPTKELKWGSITGTVTKIVESGDAYVSCPEVNAIYGKDPYIFRKVVKMCELQQGDEIRFDLHINERNQPQVPAPIWKKNCENHKGGGKGKGGDGKGKGKGEKGWWDSWQPDAWGKGDGWSKGKGGGGGWGDSWHGDGWFSQMKGLFKGAMKGDNGGWGDDSWQLKSAW